MARRLGQKGPLGRTLLAALLVTLGEALVAAPPDVPADGASTFDVVASRFKFEPETLEVEEGDFVVLNVRSADVRHGLSIKGLKVKTEVPKSGEVVTVRFVAAKAGTFPITCSQYCGSGHSRMRGRLVVLPRAAS